MHLRSAGRVASVLFAIAAPAAATTFTVTAGGNNDGGVMFDLSVRVQAITLQSLGIYAKVSGASTSATVYMRTGSYYGFSGSSDGWTNLGSFTVAPTPFQTNVLRTLDFDDVALAANSTYGFFVTLGGTSATLATGGFAARANSDVSLPADAVGKRGFSGFTNIQRSFSGTINYAITPAADAPPPAAALPEPASWAMMVGVFAMLGGALRRRARPGVRLAH